MTTTVVITLSTTERDAAVSFEFLSPPLMVRVRINKKGSGLHRESTHPCLQDETIADAFKRVVTQMVFDGWSIVSISAPPEFPMPLCLEAQGTDWSPMQKAFTTFDASIRAPLTPVFKPLAWGAFHGRNRPAGWQIKAVLWIPQSGDADLEEADQHLAILAQLPGEQYLAHTPNHPRIDACRALLSKDSPGRRQLLRTLEDNDALPQHPMRSKNAFGSEPSLFTVSL